MNRLTKKCIVASAGMHVLLILVLLVGPAFFTKKPEPMQEIITLVDATITDGKTRGGGNPTVQEPPPPAPPVVEPPPPQPPPPEPEPPKPVVQQPAPIPEPPKVVEQVKTKEPDVVVPKVVKTPTKPAPKPQIALTPVTNKPAPQKVESPKPAPVFTPTTRSQTVAKTQTQPSKPDTSAQLANQLKDIRKSSQNIASKAASSTSVELSGPGGEAFVNYRQLVAAIYERAYDRALIKAGEIGDRDDSVDVSIVIASNGRVVSSRITRSSANPALNRLVNGILDSVDSVPGFPPGSREAQQTFNIKFDLKSRRLTG